jgi:Fe2+ or Zn2+ uptake regulation protein
MQYRNTKQKNIIFSTIDDYGHISVDELINILKEQNADISLATIYRNLNILTEEGKIKKVHTEDLTVYETIKTPHYHFECEKCHNIVDIDPDLISIKINYSIADVSKKDLFLYGICNNCINKN